MTGPSAWTLEQRARVSLAAKKSNAARSLRIWPLHKVETLRFLVDAGMHSFKQIGETMGIGPNMPGVGLECKVQDIACGWRLGSWSSAAIPWGVPDVR